MSASYANELFTEPARSWDILDQQRDRIAERVDLLSVADFQARPASVIVDELCDRYSLNVPVLHEAAATARQEETELPAGRRLLGHQRMVRGLRVVIAVPFTGDRPLFDLRPDTYEELPTPKGSVEGGSVIFSVAGEQLTAEEVRAAYDGWLLLVNRHLEIHREKLGGFNEGLRAFVSNAVEERMTRLRGNAELLARLGLPVAA